MSAASARVENSSRDIQLIGWILGGGKGIFAAPIFLLSWSVQAWAEEGGEGDEFLSSDVSGWGVMWFIPERWRDWVVWSGLAGRRDGRWFREHHVKAFILGAQRR